ncbi:MAG: adenosine-specific kinase [Candidatus Micrarchaeia archaeon]|jgi:adenosine/AMP kinase
MEPRFEVVEVKTPENCNVILGQTHFIKSAEDLYEAIAESSSSVKFGVAFCEASGERLVRSEGNNEELQKAAEQAALAIGAGHVFVVFLRDAFPINVLNRIKSVSEVCCVYCATANPLQVIVAETSAGRGVAGVIDGATPLGVEGEKQRRERRQLLRKFGYKK